MKIRELVSQIGPYPYNPYLIFLFFFSIFFSRFIPVVVYQPFGADRLIATFVVIFLAFIPSSIFALIAFLFEKFRLWNPNNLIAYICEVALGVSVSFFYAPLMREILTKLYHFNIPVPFTLTLGFFTGSLIAALIALALMHRAERGIAERLRFADNLVTKLESERQGLIHSDERLRRHTSQFLHDRVQSDLMVVGMKLKSISGQSSPEINEVIDRAIHRLEKTRSSDLRNLIQILTPNIEAGTVASAIDTLLEQYRSNMEIAVKINSATEKMDSESLLGIFRIIEQSILNALVHGPANRVQIHISTSAERVTEIVVSDDGPGTELEKVNAGVGTAIIDSWVGILHGSKEIDSAPGHGYRLKVTFPK